MDLVKACAYNAKRHADKHFEALALHGWLPQAFSHVDPGSVEEVQVVKAWQEDLGVDADGACGPGTWAAARKRAWPDQPPIPHDRSESLKIYGDPCFQPYPNPKTRLDRGRLKVSAAWKNIHLTNVELQGQTYPCHVLVAQELRTLTAMAVRETHYSPVCNGVFVPRRRNWETDESTPPSNHSWGAAVDFDSMQNGRGLTATEMRKHRLFPAIFEVAGWCWGGTFKTPDDMHLQRGTGF